MKAVITKIRHLEVMRLYRNLEAEMARAGVTQFQLSKELEVTPTTMSLKLNGKSNLTLQECVKIKHFLGTDETIDYLFETEDGR